MKPVSIFILLLIAAGLYAESNDPNRSDPNSIDPGAVPQAVQVQAEAGTEGPEPELPEKDSKEYWVVRSQAMQEFIPFLTKKRAEIKSRQKMIADYLLEIGRAEEFAAQDIPVTYDPQVYAEILKIGQGLEQLNVQLPSQRPSWDDLVEIAMKHVVFEGYAPAEIEDGELQQYIDMCKKKEEFGQKVRSEGRTIMDQCAKMWVYLDRIGQLGAFKSHEADIALQRKADIAEQRAALMEEKQQAAFARSQDRKQQEYEEQMARQEFRSTRYQRGYESRYNQQLYRQSRLDERYTNSRAYYY